MQDFDIKLAAGEVRIIDVQADYIYYRAGSAGGADAAIEFAPRSGGETIFLYPGQAYRVPPSLRGLGASWSLKNRKGEAPIVGVVILGEGEFQDNRISGSVEVIDGGKARTLVGSAFSTAFGSGGAVPGCYARVALFNPANSGKNIVVECIAMSADVTASVNLHNFNAQLSGLVRPGMRKLINQAAQSSAATISQDNVAVARPAQDAIWQLSVPPNGKDTWQPKEPIVVVPGSALLYACNLTNTGFAASMEWFEEAI